MIIQNWLSKQLQMKKLLDEETKQKVTDSIISVLAENKCTYSDFQEINKSVTNANTFETKI